MAHTMWRWFRERGHQMSVVTRTPHPQWQHITTHLKRTAEANTALDAADVIFTHLDETPYAASEATRRRKPLVHVLHNDRQLTYHRVQYAALIVANSTWIAEAIPQRYVSIPRMVVYPPTLDVASKPVHDRRRDAVATVNLMANKGAPLFYQLAQREPGRRFIGVAGAYGVQTPAPRLDNLEIWPTRPYLDVLWANTRIYIQASAYESWGKAAIEAAARAIPTIAHPTSGLRESLGEAGTYADRKKPEAWIAALHAWDDPAAYAEASAAARERAETLESISQSQLSELEATIANL